MSRQLTSRAIVALTIRIAVAWIAASTVAQSGYILLSGELWFGSWFALGFVLFVVLVTLLVLFADVIADWLVPTQTLTFSSVDRSRVFNFALRLFGFWIIADGIPKLVQLSLHGTDADIIRATEVMVHPSPLEHIFALLLVILAGYLMLFKSQWLTGLLERWQVKLGVGKDEPPLAGPVGPQIGAFWETPLFAIAVRLLGIWFVLLSVHALVLAGWMIFRDLHLFEEAVITSALGAKMVTGAIVRVILGLGMIAGSSWVAARLFGKTVLLSDGRETVALLMDGGMVDEYFCDECGQSVPEKAAACPFCGDDFQKGKT